MADVTYLDVAAAAARYAGAYQREQFGTIDDHEYKSPGDPVSDVDYGSEKRILNQLTTAFPEHAVLSEESGLVGTDDANPTHCWIVDPLDGTSNFLRESPEFAVSIALEVEDDLEVGVVYQPMVDTLFATSLNDATAADVGGVPLGIAPTEQLASALIAIPYSSSRLQRDAVWTAHRELGSRVEVLRSSGSGALDLAYLAAGRIDAVVGFNQSRWDCAAGLILAETAGATITDFTGGPDYDEDFVATNGDLHSPIVDLFDGSGR